MQEMTKQQNKTQKTDMLYDRSSPGTTAFINEY